MKPIDCYMMAEAFVELVKMVPREMKVSVAEEFYRSLPPAQLSGSYQATRTWIDSFMSSTIEQLKADYENNAGPQEGTPQEEATKAAITEPGEPVGKQDTGTTGRVDRKYETRDSRKTGKAKRTT